MTGNHEPAQESWDRRYQESDQIWSGRVNTALADVAESLTPGTALDLGSGEGADVLWLAAQGWRATGIDISQVAVERARTAAADHGLDEQQVRFTVADLSDWQSDATYDLVTSSFLHSRGQFDRGAILRTAIDAVAPGGHFLIISHASFPPWAKAHRDPNAGSHHHDETTPASELELLQLDPAVWDVVIAELRPREVTGPDGENASLDDTVVLLRNTAVAR